MFCAVAALAACAHGGSAQVDGGGGGGGDAGAGVDAAGSGTGDAGPDCGGMTCNAIFVATSGDDGAAGTMDAPLATVSAGVRKAAQTSPALPVYVQAGIYHEGVQMSPGVTVYGGFDTMWKRADQNTTEIDGPSPAVAIDQTHLATGLDELTIRARLRPKWLGICRPPELGSAARAYTESMKSSGVMPRAMQKARSR